MRARLGIGLVGLIVSAAAGATPSAAQMRLEWEVADRFRTVREPTEAYVQRLRRFLDCASPMRGGEPECRSFWRKAEGLPPISNPGLGDVRTHWVSGEYRYDPAWIHDTARKIRIQVRGAAPGARCEATNETLDVTVSGDCASLPLLDARLGRQTIAAAVSAGGRSQTLRAVAELRDLLVVNLGDSVGSGEGNPHEAMLGDWGERRCDLVGPSRCWVRPSIWWETRCSRSLLSAGALAAAFYAASPASASTSVTFVSFACSGAKSEHVWTPSGGRPYGGQASPADVRAYRDRFIDPAYRARIPDPFPNPLPPQIVSLRNLLACPNGRNGCAPRRPDHVFVSLGANDIRFGEIFETLALGERVTGSPNPPAREELRNWVRQGLSAMEGNLAATADELQRLGARQVTLLGYPNPARDSRGRYCNGEVGEGLLFAGATRITTGESSFAERRVWQPLNDRLRRIAERFAQRGWAADMAVAEAPTSNGPSTRTGFCARPSWWISYMEAVFRQGIIKVATQGAPSGTFHPNVLAHAALARSLEARLAGRSVAESRTATAPRVALPAAPARPTPPTAPRAAP
jgi:hypothetical protein